MSEDVDRVVKDLIAKTEKIGLHLRGLGVIGSNKGEDDEDESGVLKTIPDSDELKAKIKSGDVDVLVMTVFSTKEIAFSDRVQNPQKVKNDDEFKAIVPSEFEVLREQIARARAEGRNPFKRD